MDFVLAPTLGWAEAIYHFSSMNSFLSARQQRQSAATNSIWASDRPLVSPTSPYGMVLSLCLLFGIRCHPKELELHATRASVGYVAQVQASKAKEALEAFVGMIAKHPSRAAIADSVRSMDLKQRFPAVFDDLANVYRLSFAQMECMKGYCALIRDEERYTMAQNYVRAIDTGVVGAFGFDLMHSFDPSRIPRGMTIEDAKVNHVEEQLKAGSPWTHNYLMRNIAMAGAAIDPAIESNLLVHLLTK